MSTSHAQQTDDNNNCICAHTSAVVTLLVATWFRWYKGIAAFVTIPTVAARYTHQNNCFIGRLDVAVELVISWILLRIGYFEVSATSISGVSTPLIPHLEIVNLIVCSREGHRRTAAALPQVSCSEVVRIRSLIESWVTS